MAGEHAVRPRAARGQRAALDVADGDLQHALARAVIDGQGAVDLRDLDIAHDARAGDVQQAVIDRLLLLAHHKAPVLADQRLIVRLGLREQLVKARMVQLRDRVAVAGNRAGLMHGIPPVADGGVQHQGEPCKEHQYQRNR